MKDFVWFGEGEVWGVGRFGEWGGLGRYVVWEGMSFGEVCLNAAL